MVDPNVALATQLRNIEARTGRGLDAVRKLIADGQGLARERCAGSLCSVHVPRDGLSPVPPPLLHSTQRPVTALRASP